MGKLWRMENRGESWKKLKKSWRNSEENGEMEERKSRPFSSHDSNEAE